MIAKITSKDLVNLIILVSLNMIPKKMNNKVEDKINETQNDSDVEIDNIIKEFDNTFEDKSDNEDKVRQPRAPNSP